MSGEIQRFRQNNSDIVIGRFTYGFRRMTVVEYGEGAKLEIGAFCSLATGLKIFLGGDHRIDWITTFPFGKIFAEELGGAEIVGHPSTKGDVVIGDDVWIADNVTILSGVKIGAGAAIGANATVVRDVAPYEVVGGNPARAIRTRFEPEVVDLLLRLRWWDLPTEAVREIAPELSRAPTVATLSELIARFGR